VNSSVDTIQHSINVSFDLAHAVRYRKSPMGNSCFIVATQHRLKTCTHPSHSSGQLIAGLHHVITHHLKRSSGVVGRIGNSLTSRVCPILHRQRASSSFVTTNGSNRRNGSSG